MKYIIIFFAAFFSLAFGLVDPDPPQCTDGLGHVKHRYLYSLRDTTGLAYSFDTTFEDRRDELGTTYTDSLEWLVIPAGWDTLVFQCARCDSVVKEPSSEVRQIARIMEEVKVEEQADLTPDAVNWSNVEGYGFAESETKQIKGIDENITIKIEYNNNIPANATFKIYQNVNNQLGGTQTTITSSGQEIEINKNYYVTFTFYCTGYTYLTSTITVKNASDGNAVLDTFTLGLDCE